MLAVSTGTLAPVFAPTTTAYTVGPGVLATTAQVTPTAQHAGATIAVNGAPVGSGAASAELPLTMGTTTVTVVVTAADATTVRTYTVVFDRTSAALSNLVVSAGALAPAFEPGTLQYAVGPSFLPSTTTLTPTTQDPAATVTVAAVLTPSGTASASIPLAAGPTPLELVVTARDGVTKTTYEVVFRRTLRGDGTFRSAVPPTVAVGNQPASLAVGDWNGDGHLDLAVGNHLGGTLSILLGNGHGAFTAGTPVALAPGNGAFDLRAGTLDAGSTLDLVVADSNNGTASVFLGNGNGTFTPGVSLTVAGGDDVLGVALADVNGDLKLDVLATARAPGLVGVFLGAGNGTFTPATPATFVVGFEARQCTVGDFDGNSVPDVAVSIRNGQQIEVHLGQGNGAFAAVAGSPFAAGGKPWVLAAADFDGNGTLDLAAPGDTSNAVALLSGNGLGAFAAMAGSPLAAGAAPYGIAHGDLNGDGRPDLVVANLSGNSLSVYLREASGFVPAPVATIPVGSGPFPVQLADLDEDGVLDLVVANENDNTVSVLLGNPQ